MAAFADLGQEESDGDVVGNFALDASQLIGLVVDPDKATNSGENAGGTRGGAIHGVWDHAVFGEHAVGARFMGNEGKDESVARGVDKFVAVLVLLGDFFVSVVLRAAICHREIQG